MNKNQALAVMDAHMHRASADRRRWFDRRHAFMLRLYPSLRRAAPEEREGLLREARRHAFGQWSVYAAMVLVMALLAWLLSQHDIASRLATSIVTVIAASAALPAGVLFLHMRSYLDLRIGIADDLGGQQESRREP